MGEAVEKRLCWCVGASHAEAPQGLAGEGLSDGSRLTNTCHRAIVSHNPSRILVGREAGHARQWKTDNTTERKHWRVGEQGNCPNLRQATGHSLAVREAAVVQGVCKLTSSPG